MACTHQNSRVVMTRKWGAGVYRRRKCPLCDASYKTAELVCDAWPEGLMRAEVERTGAIMSEKRREEGRPQRRPNPAASPLGWVPTVHFNGGYEGRQEE